MTQCSLIAVSFPCGNSKFVKKGVLNPDVDGFVSSSVTPYQSSAEVWDTFPYSAESAPKTTWLKELGTFPDIASGKVCPIAKPIV